MPTENNYLVKTPVTINGMQHPAGAVLGLTQEDAQPFLDDGSIEPSPTGTEPVAAAEEPVAPPAASETATAAPVDAEANQAAGTAPAAGVDSAPPAASV